MNSNAPREGFVDICRGVAILMVISVHVGLALDGLPVWLVHSTALGQLGVQLFFVTSAYTLCESASRRRSEKRWVLGFFVRRWFRIAPLYYIAIFFYFCVSLVTARYGNPSILNYSEAAIAANLIFIHGFFPFANNNIVPGGWSIGCEMAFYSIFPLIFIWLSSLKSDAKRGAYAALFAVSISCASCIFALYINDTAITGNNTFYYYNIGNQMPCFLVGMAAFYWRKTSMGTDRNFTCTISFISITFSIFLFYSGEDSSFSMIPLFCGTGFAAFVLFLRNTQISLRPIEYIGLRSYSVYIFHFVFAFQGTRLFAKALHRLADVPAPIIFILALAGTSIATLLIAVQTEMLIERPFISLGHRLAKKAEAQGIIHSE